MAKENLTLATICGGGVQERVNRALQKVSENILDPNTDPGKKRSITITLTLKPNEDDREDVVVDVSIGMKLAPETDLKTQMYLAKNIQSGMVNIMEHTKGQIKGQLSFDDLEQETPGFDPETGENLPETGKVVNLRAAQS